MRYWVGLTEKIDLCWAYYLAFYVYLNVYMFSYILVRIYFFHCACQSFHFKPHINNPVASYYARYLKGTNLTNVIMVR